MEENQNYGIPAQDVGFENQGVDGVVINSDFNNVTPSYINGAVTNEAVVTEATVTEAVVNEAVVGEAAPAAVEPPAPAKEAVEQLNIPEVPEGVARVIVKTTLLKEALKKADTVASKVDLQPVTEVVMFRVVGNVLQVRTTDRDNILTVNVPVIEATDGLVFTLRLDGFKVLVDKLTNNATALIVNGSMVTVKSCTGEYNYSQALDLTTNEVIVIPDIDANSIPFEETVQLDGKMFIKPIEAVAPIVAKISEDNRYAALSLGTKVSATTGDEVAVAFDNLASVLGTTAQVKLTTIKEILSMGVEDKVNIGFGQLGNYKTMCIYTGNYRLYSVLKEGEDEYPFEEIDALLAAPVGAAITVNRAELYASIDRLSLFFASNLARQCIAFNKNVGTRLGVSNESKAAENLPVLGDGTVTTKIDRTSIDIALKAIKTDDVILEPIMDGSGPVSNIKISSADRKVVYVICAAL